MYAQMSSSAVMYTYRSPAGGSEILAANPAAMNFAIHEDDADAIVDDNGGDSKLTFRFLSALRPFETRPSVGDQKHLMAALKLSLPYSTILLSRERTAIYPVLQFSHGNYDVNTKTDSYTVQGYATRSCLYSEIRGFEPSETENGQNDSRSNTYFIILGFKTSDTQALLDSWKDWTGARFMYINFPDQMSLRKITLYHKMTSDEVNLFNYIVKVECDGVNDKEKQLRALLMKTRNERKTNEISLKLHNKLLWNIIQLQFFFSILCNGYELKEPPTFAHCTKKQLCKLLNADEQQFVLLQLENPSSTRHCIIYSAKVYWVAVYWPFVRGTTIEYFLWREN